MSATRLRFFADSEHMGKPITLLAGLCGHALSLGAQSIEVEYRDRRAWVIARKDGVGIEIASYPTSSADAKELRANLYAAAKKPVRTVIAGQVYILRVGGVESFGEDAFAVSMDSAPKLDPSISPSFTTKQGQYLAFIHHYTKIHRQSPAETDLQRYFRVFPALYPRYDQDPGAQWSHRKGPWSAPIHSAPGTTGEPAAVGLSGRYGAGSNDRAFNPFALP